MRGGKRNEKMTKFIIVRHGQSEANLKEIYAGRFDVPLTATGKKQAELVTEYVLKTYRVDAVYSSPLLRARETVKEIAPRQVMIYTIDRETPDHDLEKATHEELDRIGKLIKDSGIPVSVSY